MTQTNNAASAAKEAMQAATGKLTVKEKISQTNSMLGLTQSEISSYLMNMKNQVAAVLPKHLTAERVLQMAATTIKKNPNIAKCTPASLLGSVMQASILGFPPVDALGYCYFVPYGKDVQFQIGYRGYIELARRSGKIKTVYAEAVREGDEFNVEYGVNRKLEHKPCMDSSKPITHVYAVCHYNDGGYNFVVLSRSDVERLRMRSPMQKGAPSGAWATDYEAMAKAKALKQLSKYLPLNIDQASAIATDETVLKPENFQDGTTRIEDIEYSDPVPEEAASAEETHEAVPSGELFGNGKQEGGKA